MPGGQIMDFEMMFSNADVSERAVSVKTDIEETPIASNTLMTLDEFLGCDYEGDNWPKACSYSKPSSFGTNTSDSWYVTSVTRDCSTDNYESDGKSSKQITIRLPLKSRHLQTTEPSTHQLESLDPTLHNPMCITPDTSAIINEPKFPEAVKIEKDEEEKHKRQCSYTPEISAKRTKINIDKQTVVEPVMKSECKTVKPPRKTRKPRTYKYDPKPLKRKDGKKNIPDVLKDEEYWENRKRNNEAAKKSRVNRRTKELELVSRMGLLKDENDILKASVKKLLDMNTKLEAELAIIK